MKSLRGKRAVVGVGMLIIFISTILVSAIAAGVILRSSGLLQARAFEVEEETRERLLNRVDFVTIYALVNTSTEGVYGLEIITRLGAGSNEIELTNMGISMLTETNSYEFTFHDNTSNCNMGGIAYNSEYCHEMMFGNNNTILEDEDVLKLRFYVNQTISAGEDVELNFIPADGSVTSLYFRAPKSLTNEKVSIRI